MSLDYDPLSTRWKDDPYPIYQRLRDESPLYRSDASGVYWVSRFEDVLNDPETFSSRAMFTVLMTYLRGVLKERRERPSADLISTLIASQTDAAGLSDYEVMMFIQVLLVAGHEKTTNLIEALVPELPKLREVGDGRAHIDSFVRGPTRLPLVPAA